MHRHSRALLALAVAFTAGVAFWLTTDQAPAIVSGAVALAVFGACAHAFGEHRG